MPDDRITVDSRGRSRIYLGRSRKPIEGWRRVSILQNRLPCSAWVHPAANSGGWQYLSRYLIYLETGEPLRPDEHVHHRDKNPINNQPGNLSVMLAEYHGRLHAYGSLRLPDGTFAAPVRLPRNAAIIGNAAEL